MKPSKRDLTVAAANSALTEFNQRNREFWADQRTLMDRRMADRAILETAVESVESETKRQVPIRSQKSFEEALQDAEKAKIRFIRKHAQSGGKAAKADSLQKMITDIVRQIPEITAVQLLLELRKQERNGIIDEVDETRIYYEQTGIPVILKGGAALRLGKIIKTAQPRIGRCTNLTESESRRRGTVRLR
jgi:hypothetical protein